MVSVDVAEPPEGGETDAGLSDAVTPAGAPEVDRPTVELKPLIDVTFIVEVLKPPWGTVKEADEAEIEKSGAAAMVRPIVTLWVSAPLVPATVRV